MALIGLALLAAATLPPSFDNTLMIDTGKVLQISPHAYVIQGFPNIGIVVGDKDVLVVDTGMGQSNGANVYGAAVSLAKRGQRIMLTTTHFHPEHEAGASGFPAGTPLIRSRAQQAELEKDGPEVMDMFRKRNADNARLLADYRRIDASVVFDDRHDLDLGGVTVELLAVGPAHTAGDEAVYVKGDSVLYPGDLVQDRVVPHLGCADCSPRSWLVALDRIAALHPRFIASDHGNLGGAELIPQERGFFETVERVSADARSQGLAGEEAVKAVTDAMAAAYPDWIHAGGMADVARRAVAERP